MIRENAADRTPRRNTQTDGPDSFSLSPLLAPPIHPPHVGGGWVEKDEQGVGNKPIEKKRQERKELP
ncbi:MAG: hypothetical protein V1766_05360 [Pseudomonadota bacterium]